jgi:hypothetical protein
MRCGWLVALLLVAGCADDTTSAAPQDMASCLPGTSAPPCPTCMPRSGDPCPAQVTTGCSYPTPSPVPIVCLCGAAATWSCAPASAPHDLASASD